MLPGGPDESSRLGELYTKIAEVEEAAEKLEASVVLRPSPSQYISLQQEVQRFATSFAAAQRIAGITNGLKVRTDAFFT